MFDPILVHLGGELVITLQDIGSEGAVVLVDQVEQDSLLILVDFVDFGNDDRANGHDRFGSQQGLAFEGAVNLDDGNFGSALRIHGIEAAFDAQIGELVRVLFEFLGSLHQAGKQIKPDGDDFFRNG